MTFSILNTTTNKVINRSSVRPAGDPVSPNLRLDPLTTPEVVTSRHLPSTLEHSKETSASAEPNAPDDHATSSTHPMPILDPNDLVGRTFLIPQEDGQRLRARIVKAIDDYEGDLQRDSSRMKFICSTKDDTVEDVFTYNKILDHINVSEDDDLIEWKFKAITAHEGPLATSHPNYNGSSYNLRIEWENGEITNEPLNIIAADDPVSCAIYARDNNLLDKPG